MSVTLDNSNYIQEDVALLKDVFPDADVGDLDHYRWKYFGSSHGKGFTVKDIEGGRVIGRMGVIPQKIRADLVEDNCVIGWSVDSAVERRHRNFFICARCFQKTVETARDLGYRFIYAMPCRNSYSVITKGFGFKKVFSFKPIVYFPLFFKGSRSPLRALFCNVATIPLNLLGRAICPSTREKVQIKEGFFSTSDWYCMDSDVFKDEEYLSWRYQKCPTRKYIFLALMDGDDFLANVVLRSRICQGIEMLIVVDVFISDKVEAGKDKIGSWLSHVAEEFHRPLVFFVNNGETQKIFGRAGFFGMPKKMLYDVVVYPLREQEDPLLDKVHFSLGDTDVI